MAVAAVLTNTFEIQREQNVFGEMLPTIFVVPEMVIEQQTRERAAEFIGSALLGVAVEVQAIDSPIESLFEAIHLAAEGNADALELVRVNAKTDVIERTIKTGHVMDPVPLIAVGDGFMQHGQSTENVQANSLRYAAGDPVMRARTEAETRNVFRTNQLYADNFFDNYDMLVISRAEKLPGFFTETMSCSLQLTGKTKDGLQIESAFVSGKTSVDDDETIQVQHDEQTVVGLGEMFGVDLKGMSAAEIIDTPILIRKDLIPNGVIDVVKLYDDCAGGMFFGERKPRQDYLAYREQCHAREAKFTPKVDQIVSDLLAEKLTITTPVEAIERLHNISEKHMVEYAVFDKTIDVRVFGTVAAPAIIQARYAAEQGNWQVMNERIHYAVNNADTNSCPSGLLKKGRDEDDSNATSSEESEKDCDFVSKECPICKKKDVKTTVTKTHISGECGCSIKRDQP